MRLRMTLHLILSAASIVLQKSVGSSAPPVYITFSYLCLVLGVPYDPALDMWSIGCTLYELYTGKILFPGRSNNQMLLLMMELKGRFNSKMIKKAKFGELYFDEMGGFESVETDRVTGAVCCPFCYVVSCHLTPYLRMSPARFTLKGRHETYAHDSFPRHQLGSGTMNCDS